MRYSHPPARESGQAAVEAALVVPMMVFLVLGIIQLAMMHQARMMTEYAAYRAARAGIVNHGHCGKMYKSALLSVVPTLGPPVSIGGTTLVPGRADNILYAKALFMAYKESDDKVKDGKGRKYFGSEVPVLQVEVVNPRQNQLASIFNTYGSRMERKEIDFDDIRDSTVIAANLLSVRVTYYYEMRIPFANKLIHSWWIGYQYLSDLKGVQFDNKRALYGSVDGTKYLEGRVATESGIRGELAKLALRPLKSVYVIPLVSTYSMRMQSNLMQEHVRHCAVNG